MRIVPIIAFVTLLTSLQAASAGADFVKAKDYCVFLNQVVATDFQGEYDEKMEGLMRVGEPGQYSYVVASGAEEKPIAYIDQISARSYCDWLENTASTFNFNCCEAAGSFLTACDKQLRSNRSIFYNEQQPNVLTVKSSGDNDGSWGKYIREAASIAVVVAGAAEAGPLTLDHFRRAATDHPNATGFILREEEEGHASLEHQENSLGNTDAENQKVLRRLKDLITLEHSEEIANGIPELTPLAFISARPLSAQTLTRILHQLPSKTSRREGNQEKALSLSARSNQPLKETSSSVAITSSSVDSPRPNQEQLLKKLKKYNASKNLRDAALRCWFEAWLNAWAHDAVLRSMREYCTSSCASHKMPALVIDFLKFKNHALEAHQKGKDLLALGWANLAAEVWLSTHGLQSSLHENVNETRSLMNETRFAQYTLESIGWKIKAQEAKAAFKNEEAHLWEAAADEIENHVIPKYQNAVAELPLLKDYEGYEDWSSYANASDSLAIAKIMNRASYDAAANSLEIAKIIAQAAAWKAKEHEASRDLKDWEARLWKEAAREDLNAAQKYREAASMLVMEGRKNKKWGYYLDANAFFILEAAKVFACGINVKIQENQVRNALSIEEADLWQEVVCEIWNAAQYYKETALAEVSWMPWMNARLADSSDKDEQFSKRLSPPLRHGDGHYGRRFSLAARSTLDRARAMEVSIAWKLKEKELRSVGRNEEADWWKEAVIEGKKAIQQYRAAVVAFNAEKYEDYYRDIVYLLGAQLGLVAPIEKGGNNLSRAADATLEAAQTMAEMIAWRIKARDARRMEQNAIADLWQEALGKAESAVQEYRRVATATANDQTIVPKPSSIEVLNFCHEAKRFFVLAQEASLRAYASEARNAKKIAEADLWEEGVKEVHQIFQKCNGNISGDNLLFAYVSEVIEASVLATSWKVREHEAKSLRRSEEACLWRKAVEQAICTVFIITDVTASNNIYENVNAAYTALREGKEIASHAEKMSSSSTR